MTTQLDLFGAFAATDTFFIVPHGCKATAQDLFVGRAFSENINGERVLSTTALSHHFQAARDQK